MLSRWVLPPWGGKNCLLMSPDAHSPATSNLPETATCKVGKKQPVSNSARLILFGCLCAFLVSLDFNIVNVALPTISRKFHIDLNMVSWVAVIYLMIIASFVPIAGNLCDLIGFRRVYPFGLLLFGAGSLACGLAPHIYVLIAARAVQGLGAAVLTLTPALFAAQFSANQCARALSFLAISQSLGMCIGPSLGGLITQFLRWEWVFYINIPLCLVALYWSRSMIDEPTAGREVAGSKKFDFAGGFLGFFLLLSLLYALSGGEKLGWASTPVLVAGGIALISGVTFFARELRATRPVIRLSLFADVPFAVVTSCLLLVLAVISGVAFLLPFNLEEVVKMSPGMVGAVILSYPVVMAITAYQVPRLKKKLGTLPLMLAGTISLFISMLLYATIKPQTSIWFVVAVNGLRGLGFGLYYPLAMHQIVSGGSEKERGMASAILYLVMSIGALAGVRIFQSAHTFFAQSSSSGQIVSYQYDYYIGAAIMAVVFAMIMIHGLFRRESAKQSEDVPAEVL